MNTSSKEEFLWYVLVVMLGFHGVIQFVALLAKILDNLWHTDENGNESEPLRKIIYKQKFEEILEDPAKSVIYEENGVGAAQKGGEDDVEKEVEWKRRILMEYVEGYGNIIMTYDYYRRGFCYYCDLSSIPYTVLIEIAYKYMVLYRCVSFASPAQPVEDTPHDENPTTKKTASYKINSFEAKMRGCGDAAAAASETQTQDDKPCVKIIRMGKVCDFLFLAKPVSKVAMIETKQLSYKDFISQQQQQKHRQPIS